MEDDKLSTIMDWPYPTNSKELNRFLGFLNFYRKFIKGFSRIAAPLTDLTKEKVNVVAGLAKAESMSSFKLLKSCFQSAPLLFSFLSKKWSSKESAWQVHDQELGAVVQSFIEWRAWLIDTPEPVEVMSDHSNLKYFMKSNNLSDRQTRWAAFLASFNFVIKHIPGKLNPADPATRRPDFIPDRESPNAKRTLLVKSAKGLKLQETTLEDEGTQAEIWEVSTSVSQTQADIDYFFCPPSQEFRKLLLASYSEQVPVPSTDEELTCRNGLWWTRGRIFVPENLRPRVLKEYHDGALAGHLGSFKTLEAIGRTMTWPGIRQDVLKYTKSCFSCQRAKHSTQKTPGVMHSLQVPDRPWSCIGIDFVVKLPPSEGFDSVLVIVDHFSKGIHLILALETWTAEEFAYSFFDRFIRYHGLPDKIVSDRGALFVSKFWKEMQRLLRISAALSTAWHPRTDGQTERANQTFETYLRHFVSDRQDDWAKLLPIAELVFNSSVSASSGSSPFFSQFAFHPRKNMFNKGSRVPAADQWLENLVSVQETLLDNIHSAKEYQKRYFDLKARDVPTYEKGDWVWLLWRNIATTRPSTKLDFKRLGPFKVDLPMGNDVYKLILPTDLLRLHPVFHVSLLLPFVDPRSFPGRIGSKAPRGPSSLTHKFWDEHDVEAILGYRSPAKGRHEYLIRWRGGSTADDSWERGGFLSPNLHPYLELFHDTFGGKNIILPPDRSVRILC
ncbi:hypothetical protein PCANC_14321 [Puccinia coronata f. sp. avenae]|uniref:Integrase catalytic domain-containing protein n=1 Tax=Puccinia coronata f. sp. avenae TaxID=200324 RepID=A0A2N5VLE9_9BASI|nr:hypothetical protein PCANC_14321 [Puccinia coronata f. sp. avenae]